MKQSRALATCAQLERRAAAALRATNAEQSRVGAAVTCERTQVVATRTSLASLHMWTAEICAAVESSSSRSRRVFVELARRRASAQREAADLEMERRRWARIVRGLERRIARRLDQDPTWAD